MKAWRERKAAVKKHLVWHVVDLGIDASNHDLVNQMQIMATTRKAGIGCVCAIRGFRKDNRELCDIPEVRAFCRRLCDQGFLSDLDPSASIPEMNPGHKAARDYLGTIPLGALEVWSIAENIYRPIPGTTNVGYTGEQLVSFLAALEISNAVNDKALGREVNL